MKTERIERRKPSILIVDDSPLVRYQLVDIFEDLGFEVAGEVSNGIEAIMLYKENKTDFITLDLMMPEKDGYDTLDELLNIDPAARVVMITAIGKQDMVAKCLKRGALDFIIKPFNPANIKECFNALMKKDTR